MSTVLPSCLDCLQSTKCHCIVVTEYNFYHRCHTGPRAFATICCACCLIPVTNLIGQALLLQDPASSRAFTENSVLILSIYVLRITLNHDVIELCRFRLNQSHLVPRSAIIFALECTGLSSISTYISNIPDYHLPISASLSASGSRLMYTSGIPASTTLSVIVAAEEECNRVDNQNVNALCDEVIGSGPDLRQPDHSAPSTMVMFSALKSKLYQISSEARYGTVS